MAASIGTYGERALHAALKRLIEPDESLHERPYHGCVVDVLRPDGVFEVQTRAFDRLRGKLGRLLPDTAVTVVYPAVQQKWLVWVDPDTGETTKRRRSPKTGTPLAVCYELYKLRPLLPDPNLTLWIVPADVEEYRSLTGWSRDRKRGSTRLERLPVAFGEPLVLRTAADYRRLLPEGLGEPFTTAALSACGRVSPACAQRAAAVLLQLGAIERCGKRGNAYLYRRVP